MFPFPLTNAQLLGELCNNRQSPANKFSRFAYYFVSLMLRKYYWCCDSCSAQRQCETNKTNPQNILLGAAICPALPRSAGCNAVPIILSAEYMAPINMIVLTRIGNGMVKQDEGLR